jgi:hypothetical protein
LSRKKGAFIVVLVLFVLGIVARMLVVVTDPLRQSDAQVHEWLFKKTPLGSSFEDVRAVAIRDDWKIAYERPFNAPFPFQGERLRRFDVGHFHSFLIPFHAFVMYRFVDEHLVEIGKIDRIGDSL